MSNLGRSFLSGELLKFREASLNLVGSRGFKTKKKTGHGIFSIAIFSMLVP